MVPYPLAVSVESVLKAAEANVVLGETLDSAESPPKETTLLDPVKPVAAKEESAAKEATRF